MKTDSTTFKIFKNGTYSILGYLWSILFTFVVTPLIVFKLGVKEYGIYLFITTAMTLFSLLDLGIGVAVSKHMAFYLGKKDESSVIRLAHVGNLVFLITGLIGFSAAAAVTFFGVSFLPTSFSAYERYSGLFIFAGAIFFFNVVIASYNSVLYALQRFDISNKLGMLFITISSLGMLFAVWMGWSLEGVFISQLVSAVLYAVTVYFTGRKLLPVVTFKFRWHRKEFFECYKFGFVSALNTFASVALSSLDRLVIPFYVGPSNLTYYSMPGNVTTKIPGITSALSISLLPTAAELTGSDEITKMKVFYMRTFRVIIIIAGALTLTSISFSYKILEYWLSADFANKSSTVLIILALTNFILALYGPLSNFLLGLNKLKFLSTFSVFMALLNVVALFILLPHYGITGAAFAYLISVIPVFYMFYYVEHKYLSLPNRKNHYVKTFLGTFVTSVVVGVFNYGISFFITGIPTLLIAGMVSVIMYVIVYRLFGFFEEEDWRDIERFQKILLNKLMRI